MKNIKSNGVKYLVISDIHDNLVNLEKCLNWGREQSIERAICPGDLANSETLALLAKNLKIMYLVGGNAEIYSESEVRKYENINYLGRFGVFEIDGKTIGLCHEPRYLKSVLNLKKCDLVFYGHTHEPWINKEGEATITNPGTLGGVFNKPSFAVYDSANGQLELKILELL